MSGFVSFEESLCSGISIRHIPSLMSTPNWPPPPPRGPRDPSACSSTWKPLPYTCIVRWWKSGAYRGTSRSFSFKFLWFVIESSKSRRPCSHLTSMTSVMTLLKKPERKIASTPKKRKSVLKESWTGLRSTSANSARVMSWSPTLVAEYSLCTKLLHRPCQFAFAKCAVVYDEWNVVLFNSYRKGVFTLKSRFHIWWGTRRPSNPS